MSGPLAGLRVVDCSTGTAGPRATGMLADYGAEVIWVERPGGDRWRAHRAVEYSVFNRGKASVALRDPLVDEDGRRQLLGLLESADVVVQSWRPGVARSLGLDAETLQGLFPTMIVSSITGFGPDGPYRDVPGYESLVHALVGTMGEQHGHRSGPIYEGLPFASMGAASLAVLGTLAALYRRADDGVGRSVETSLYDGALVYLAMMWGDNDAQTIQEVDSATDLAPAGGSNRFICASFRCADDTYIGVHTGARGAFGRLMAVLGLDDRIAPSESGLDMGIPLTPEEMAILHGEIHGIFARHSRQVWVDRLLEADVCGIPVLQAGEVFDTPQAAHNNMVCHLSDTVLGSVDQVAPQIAFSVTAAQVQGRAPEIGEDVRGLVTRGWERPWQGAGRLEERPLLDGVKIVDLGAYYAGPGASRHMADLGAQVIKVEPPAGDPMRGLPTLFRAAQAGKRSLAVDLRDPELQTARRRLIEWADIIHHNMRPGVAERLELGYEQVREINPTVIYGYAPGWGSSGPNAKHQSFEPMMSGYVGANFEVAGQYNPPLYPAGNADPGNAMAGAIAMLMALLHRRRTGVGQYFENPQLNATMVHMAHVVRRRDGEVLGAMQLDPLQYGVAALDRLYATADGWICLVAKRDDAIAGLSEVLGVDILDDERFATQEARRSHDYELSEVIATALETMPSAACLDQLRGAAVPVATPKTYNNHAFMADAENRRTRRVAEVSHPTLGQVRELDQFVRVSRADVLPHRLAPELGEHTTEILTSLGYSPADIESLQSRGAASQFLR